MPSKKKKYNARFPAGRIKKIMQSDEEIGKVAQAVPVIISRTLELFIDSLLTKTLKVTTSRNAKTLSPSHMKQCIMSESRFDFLRELVKTIPDISVSEEVGNESNSSGPSSDHEQPYDLSKPSTSSGGSAAIESQTGQLARNCHQTQRLCTTISVPKDLSVTANATKSSDDCQSELKRQWDNVRRIRNEFEHNAMAITTGNVSGVTQSLLYHPIDNTYPPKLKRTDSTPTTSQSKGQGNPGTSKLNKRLQHQPKSLPGGSASSNNKSTPAPIVNIDFCNKPIVKIDYSNLDLHDTKYSGSKNISDSTLNVTASTLPERNTNPTVNIDLSNIYTHPTTSGTSSIFNVPGTLAPLPLPNSKSSAELDEDYDNI